MVLKKLRREVKKKSSKVSSKEKTTKNSNKGKIKCPDCSKYFTKATINKWGGTCGTCYRKRILAITNRLQFLKNWL